MTIHISLATNMDFSIHSWDEWVPENRVLKYNEANVQRQKEVYKQHSNAAGKNKKSNLVHIYISNNY